MYIYRCNMELRKNRHFYETFYLKTKKNREIIIYLTSTPKSSLIEEYSRFMKDNGVTDIFCFCNTEYDPTIIEKYGINVHNLEFADGSSPPNDILDKFNKVIDTMINKKKPTINQPI